MPSLRRKGKGQEVEEYVQARLKRGEARLRNIAPLRNECWEFFRGNHFAWRTAENTLVITPTSVSARGGKGSKDPWRQRTVRNLLIPLVRQEVSYATQRVPSYDVAPSNTDPDVVAAARVSEKIALYGYDKWRVKTATEDVVTSAIVADEGFAWPYWDAKTGPIVGDDDGNPLHRGELCIRTYTGNEVGWEPGARFEESRWYFIQQAVPLDEILAMPGLLTQEIAADATDPVIIGKGTPPANTKMALKTEYLERPGPKHAAGRRLVMAGGKVILPEEAYPLTDATGLPLDEPVLHKLSVIRDPDSDRDMGLVRFALDAMRTFNNSINKSIEFANLKLVPQIIAPPGTILTPLSDQPGAVVETPRPDLVKWREIGEFPSALFEMADRAKADLGFLFSQNDIPGQVESGKAIQAFIERDQNARSSFIANLAEFHSRLMRHCLVLVQMHYTEPRLLEINGRFGPEVIDGFRGAQLMDQVNCRVYPRSLEPRTKEGVTQQVMMFAQLGWITPHAAMAAINGGTAEKLVESYELDIGRAHYIIQTIKQGPAALFSLQSEYKDIQVPAPPDPVTGLPPVDPMTGMPVMMTEMIEVPGWMPREIDNVAVHQQVFADWMKSSEWNRLEPGMREAARQYWRALLELEKEEQARQAEAMSARAVEQGEFNAAKEQLPKPMPSLPGLNGSDG